MLVSLRGGGGELGNQKTLTYGFTNFAQSKTRTCYLDVQLGCSSVKLPSQNKVCNL
jgi:hypothetical protein